MDRAGATAHDMYMAMMRTYGGARPGPAPQALGRCGSASLKVAGPDEGRARAGYVLSKTMVRAMLASPSATVLREPNFFPEPWLNVLRQPDRHGSVGQQPRAALLREHEEAMFAGADTGRRAHKRNQRRAA